MLDRRQCSTARQKFLHLDRRLGCTTKKTLQVFCIWTEGWALQLRRPYLDIRLGSTTKKTLQVFCNWTEGWALQLRRPFKCSVSGQKSGLYN